MAASANGACQTADDVAHLVDPAVGVEQHLLLPDVPAVGSDGQDGLDALRQHAPGLGGEAAFPLVQLRLRDVIDVKQPFFEPLDLGECLALARCTSSVRQFQGRLVGVVEEGEELVILALRDRIELVVVALAAADRQAQEDDAGGVDAIDDRLDAELLEVDAAFLVDLRVAVEAGGDLLLERRRWAAGRRPVARW